jgi:hypothetical protein
VEAGPGETGYAVYIPDGSRSGASERFTLRHLGARWVITGHTGVAVN